jgi:hypothetical protein
VKTVNIAHHRRAYHIVKKLKHKLEHGYAKLYHSKQCGE